jgi:tetratricopeptide (TPR) repeat protein
MTGKFKLFFLSTIILAVLATITSVQAQWRTVKNALQKDVQIVEETAARLILCDAARQDSLVVAAVKTPEADIYGALEARRGHNPYRVWVTTEKFWRRSSLAEETARKFFRAYFVKALRQDESGESSSPPVFTQRQEKTPTAGEAEPPQLPIATAETKAPELGPIKLEAAAAESLRYFEKEASLPASAHEPAQRQAQNSDPSVRAVNRKASKPLNQESPEILVAQFYADGVAAMNRNDFDAALKAFQKVRLHDPNYREVSGFLLQIKNALAEKSNVAAHAAAPIVNSDSLYTSALSAASQGDWMQAVAALERLETLQPDYRDVVERLAQARAHLNRGASGPVAPAGNSTSLQIGGALAAFVMLSLLGAVIFSPTVRARYYLWRHDHAAAAQIYESMLHRHPSRVKYYSTLAYIYLLQGRRDEQAVKVYQIVLQLNLHVHNREEINSIMSQNSLTVRREA